MIKEGKLVRVPAEVVLKKYNINSDGPNSTVNDWKVFKEPKTFLVSDTKSIDGYVGLLFRDEVWFVHQREVYPVEMSNV